MRVYPERSTATGRQNTEKDTKLILSYENIPGKAHRYLVVEYKKDTKSKIITIMRIYTERATATGG